jgi:hypothetical protein
MKIITTLLAAAVAGVAMAYVSLYIDNQHLQDEMKQLQTNYNALVDVSATADIKMNAWNSVKSPSSVAVDVNHKTVIANAITAPAIIAVKSMQEENVKRMLGKKYAILFSTLNLSSQDKETMRALLMEREHILNSTAMGFLASEAETKASVESQQALVAQIDQQIAALLKPDDIKKYELLKDSSYEQLQINNFYDGLAAKKDLSEEKRNALLLGKLEQKQAYAAQLEASAEEINNASPADKKILAERFRDSLRAYSDNYLRIAKENLNEEQFAALSDNEKKQFEDVWQGVSAGWQGE